MHGVGVCPCRAISIHSPLAGRDGPTISPPPPLNDFNPLAPRGARPHDVHLYSGARDFNPLAPRGARRAAAQATCIGGSFQSTRPSRGETVGSHIVTPAQRISIHSPLAGRDGVRFSAGCPPSDFNPLAPRGARPRIKVHSSGITRFQSTRPSRGETWCSCSGGSPSRDFNPLAPRGARR